MLAAFLPMVVTLMMTKITKEGWDNLGICFNLKKSWYVYIISIIGTVVLKYLADPFVVILYPDNITSSFTTDRILEVLLMILLGIMCFIECLGEELGWLGYLFPKLEHKFGSLASFFILGIIRGMYHIGILIYMEFRVIMFIEITVSNIFLAPFMAWMYKKSGSICPHPLFYIFIVPFTLVGFFFKKE